MAVLFSHHFGLFSCKMNILELSKANKVSQYQQRTKHVRHFLLFYFLLIQLPPKLKCYSPKISGIPVSFYVLLPPNTQMTCVILNPITTRLCHWQKLCIINPRLLRGSVIFSGYSLSVRHNLLVDYWCSCALLLPAQSKIGLNFFRLEHNCYFWNILISATALPVNTQLGRLIVLKFPHGTQVRNFAQMVNASRVVTNVLNDSGYMPEENRIVFRSPVTSVTFDLYIGS